jgi:uncharacterized membrane protein YozB (DUF420 family)
MQVMDAKLAFWCWALANMGLVLGLCVRGWRAIRANQIDAHRRAMSWAGVFVVAFLVAYVTKRLLLGREDLAVWSRAARTNLYVHESFVMSMLIAGGTAFAFGRRLARTRRVTRDTADPLATPTALSRHRLAGRIALACAAFGFLTACGILGGMLARS